MDGGNDDFAVDDISRFLVREGLKKHRPFDYWDTTSLKHRLSLGFTRDGSYSYRQMIESLESAGAVTPRQASGLVDKLEEYHARRGHRVSESEREYEQS